MKKILFLSILLLVIQITKAQIPTDYWNTADGKTGYDLKTALFNIIKNPTVHTYKQLWTDFQSTDKRSDGKVWDIYSNTNFTFITNQCTTFTNEGDCYNREHSFPKSWFSEAEPMYSDIMHIYPVDGYTNTRRSNYPYGEVSNPTWTSTSGSKLGDNTYPGYTGTVFEPIDEYKGDLARSYFYMVTCYQDQIQNWSTVMLDGTTDHAFTDWALNMLLEWNDADPVSQKEIDRNKAVYTVQGNANPFISHPEYVHEIWGGASATNAIPYFTSTATNYINAEQTYSYYIQATDNDSSDTLSIRGANLPAFLSLSDNGDRTALLSGTPTLADTGSYTIQLYVSDGKATSKQEFSLNVVENNSIFALEEHFENFTSSSYFTGAMNLESGTWDFTQVYPENSTNAFDGAKAVRINDDKSGANITTPQVSSAGTLSFKYRTLNDESTVSTFLVQISTDGGNTFNNVDYKEFQHNNYETYTYAINNPNPMVIRILNDNQKGHLIIDALTLTFFNGGEPQNHAPEFSSTPQTSYTEGDKLNEQITSTDFDKDSLTFFSVTLPDWAHFTDNNDNTATLSSDSLKIGDYKIKLGVSDKKDTSYQEFNIHVAQNTTGVKSIEQKVVYYPNPVKNKLFINSLNSDIQLYNLQGKQMLHKKVTTSQAIDVQWLKPGIYLLRIKNTNHIYHFKLMKN